MSELRAVRESKGLQLEQVARELRIPAHYLEALESGDDDALPTGPFREGYRKQYRAYLGLAERETAPAADAPTVSLPKLLAGGFAATLVVVLGLQAAAHFLPMSTVTDDPAAALPVAATTSHDVEIRSAEPLRVRVLEDGRDRVLDLRPLVAQKASAQRELVLELPTLEDVSLTYNGERIEPLGNLSLPRRLVFTHQPAR